VHYYSTCTISTCALSKANLMVIIKLSNHVDHLQANFESMNHGLHAYKQEHDQTNINILKKTIESHVGKLCMQMW